MKGDVKSPSKKSSISQTPNIVKPKSNKNSKNSGPNSSYHTNQLHDAATRRFEAQAAFDLDRKRLADGEYFDEIMENLLSKPLNEAFEPPLKAMFQAEKAVLWIDDPSHRRLFSPTFQLISEYNSSIPGFILKNKNIVQVRDPNQAPGGFLSDPLIASPTSPQLFFPISNSKGVKAVVQIVKRNSSGPFTEGDMQAVSLIMHRISIYGDFIFQNQSLDDIALRLFSDNITESNPLDLLKTYFHCSSVELWYFDTNRLTGQRYDPSKQELVGVVLKDAGPIEASIISGHSINLSDSNFGVDPSESGPLLVVSIRPNKSIHEAWSICLRRNKVHNSFSSNEEAQITALLPFIIKSISGFSESSISHQALVIQLSELLTASAKIMASINIEQIANIIEQQATQIFQASSASFFLKNNEKNQLYCISQQRSFPIDKGIAGHILSTNSIFFTNDVSTCDFYVREYDGPMKSAFAGPIYSKSSDLIGVLLLADKVNQNAFDEDDQKVFSALSVFSGIALDNSILYKTTLNFNKMIRDFIHSTLLTNNSSELLSALYNIYYTAIDITKIHRITLFAGSKPSLILSVSLSSKDYIYSENNKNLNQDSVDLNQDEKEDSEIKPEKSFGKPFNDRLSLKEEDVNKEYAIRSMKSRNPEIVTIRNEEIDQKYPTHRISSIFKVSNSISENLKISQNDKLIVEDFPLFNAENSIIGVFEIFLSNVLSLDYGDFIKSLQNLTEVALERISLPFLNEFGYGHIEYDSSLLNIQYDNSLSFNPSDYDGIGLYYITLDILTKLGIIDFLKVSKTIIFNLILDIRHSYLRVPVHNFRHAVSTLQCLYYQIVTAKLQSILNPMEITSLAFAALFHDVKHDDFKSLETLDQIPVSILMQSHCIYESESAQLAKEILKNANSNYALFVNLSNESIDNLLNLTNKLILSTDMAKYFIFLNNLKELQGAYNPSKNPNHKSLLCEAILKISDMNLILRPCTTDQKTAQGIISEFWRQGNIQTAKLQDDKDIISFMENICLPLYEIIGKLHPPLQINVDILQQKLSQIKTKTK